MPLIKGVQENMIGFNAYTRANFNRPKTPINLGTGIFFSKENDPLFFKYFCRHPR